MARFAFYGRVSTEDQQDPESSRGWQLSLSRQLIDPAGGEIVAEFFDIGDSRSIPWKRRPEATRLLESFRDPRRGFDAVVIGEPHRAFYGNQFGLTFPVFTHYAIALWVPEVGGAIDPGSEAHDMVMSIFGGMSKGERMRIQHRVRAAMAAQAAGEGRYLGGRPPYGYRLADAGPHPNPSKAADGKRLRRLEPDPVSGTVVQRIFTEFIGGIGLHLIATSLNHDGILSPSGHDPTRNSHRASGRGRWAKSAVRAILTNPRYTGRQVWNRQRRDEVLISVDDVALGHETKMRWNPDSDWVWSAETVHEPLVSVDEFEAAQAMFTVKKQATSRTPIDGRLYQLSGLLHCSLCTRRMQGQWNHDRAYYRCKFPEDYPIEDPEHPRSVYVREDAITRGLDCWLAALFDDDHIDHTCELLAGASEPDDATEQRVTRLRSQITDCDRRLDGYRSVIDNGGDVSVVAKWIGETQRERKTLLAQLNSPLHSEELTADQVRALVEALRDVVATLGDADPADKTELYRALGVTLSYSPDGLVTVEARPRGVNVRVGGGTPSPLAGIRPSPHTSGHGRTSR
jgi:DNA invertase Pin-like site-specific DNA recombinase